jgi:beta-glucosidase
MVAHYGADNPPVVEGDLQEISAPIDFLGINNYSRAVVRMGGDGKPEYVWQYGAPHTDLEVEVYPEGLFDLLLKVHREYEPPAIYITENGAPFSDVLDHDGQVQDPERRDFIAANIEAAGRAMHEGVPLKGYFVWSLTDNFEWAHGYGKRFGIVYVNYPTLERIPKASYEWYRDFLQKRGG